jgi:hypothetical protein
LAEERRAKLNVNAFFRILLEFSGGVGPRKLGIMKL